MTVGHVSGSSSGGGGGGASRGIGGELSLIGDTSRDGCAIVYEYKGKKQPPRLLHHILDCHNEGRSEVSAVEMIQREDVSVVVTVSSNSPSLCYWNLRRNENDKNLFVSQKYDVEGFRCLALNQSQTKLAIGPNGNSKPLLLDVTTSKELSCKDLTPKPEQAVRDAQWHDENLVAYVTHAGNLQFIDTRTYNVVYDAKDPFLVTLYCVKTDGDRAILVGSAAHSRAHRRTVVHKVRLVTPVTAALLAPVSCEANEPDSEAYWDEEKLGHEFLIRQATTVNVNAATQLLTVTMVAIQDTSERLREALSKEICLVKQALEWGEDGTPPHHWDQLVAVRGALDDLKHNLRTLFSYMDYAEKLATVAAEISYLSGNIAASDAICERIDHACRSCNMQKQLTHELQQEALEMQQQAIVSAPALQDQLAKQASPKHPGKQPPQGH
ncbi:hypothetical protein MSG28_011882 [Choristoneura fumiferana]|uniref:Uncharacterized protein n=1 Tax=Choristoneura fumiferana TaxID=7141 RepID=A0ACC0KM64_CHOFU|nr:hypothetical protein MSG28_011882 [Choristoneura fumiferana]